VAQKRPRWRINGPTNTAALTLWVKRFIFEDNSFSAGGRSESPNSIAAAWQLNGSEEVGDGEWRPKVRGRRRYLRNDA
jgi:hypothetical protein